MSKRSNGEGAIYKRYDGIWCASRYVQLADGRYKRKYLYGKTQKIVKDKLKELENYKDLRPSDLITLEDWMLEWLQSYKKSQLKLTTFENYEMNVRIHIMDSNIGNVELVKLTTDMLQRFYNKKSIGTKERKGLSPRTVEYLHTLIGGALNQAYRNEMIPKNVNEFTVLPRKEEKEIIPLTIEEAQRVIEEAKYSDMYSIIVLAIYTGMRKGEVLGLQWQNIDFENKVLYVKKSLCRVKDDSGERKTKLILMEPKTKKSVRQIPLSDVVIRALRMHCVKQKEEKMQYRDIYQDNDIVFARADGSFEDPREVLRRFHKVLERAEVRKCRFHDLRHTFASILINEGESMKVVQEFLGHSTITTTMDIYSHLSDERKEKSIGVLERAIKKA